MLIFFVLSMSIFVSLIGIFPVFYKDFLFFCPEIYGYTSRDSFIEFFHIFSCDIVLAMSREVSLHDS